MPTSSIPYSFERLRAIAIAYRNANFIADKVLPRVPVSMKIFKYNEWTDGEFYTEQNTKMSRTGKAPKANFSAKEGTSQTEPYGQMADVPEADRLNSVEGIDPMETYTEGLISIVDIGREKRVADLLSTDANFGTVKTGAASGGDFVYINAASGGADPIGLIQTAMDATFYRPNIAWGGREVISALQRNPYIVKAINGTTGDSGIVTLEAIAKLFGLDAIYVGEAWINTAKKGQAVSASRLWGKNFGLAHIGDLVSADQMKATFGFTAQLSRNPQTRGREVMVGDFREDEGEEGVTAVTVRENVKELITAPKLGYLLKNLIS